MVGNSQDITVGLLAIQGAYYKHQERFLQLGVSTQLVRHAADLDVDALVIPGGESTTISKVLNSEHWSDALKQFVRERPVFGTCAGAILLSTEVDSSKVTPLGALEVKVSRNAYGRQIESFHDIVNLHDFKGYSHVPGVFIRAPKIVEWGNEVRVLGTHQNEPVLVQQGLALAATFHPELTDSLVIHQYFIDHVCQQSQAA